MRRLGTAIAVAFVALTGAAGAATVTASGTTAIYTADAGAVDALTLTAGSPGLLLTSSATITVGSNCANEGPHGARCPAATTLSATLGDGDDAADVRNGVADSVDCGSGTDRITADAADVLSGCEEIHLPAAPPGPVDADGDGALSTMDCNDANAAIRPGGVEIRGNAVDEDCDGVAEPFPSLTVSVATGWLPFTTFTRVTKLEVSAPTGSHVELSCTAKKGCPFKKKAATATKGKASLTKALADAKLKPGAVLVLRVTSPGTIGRRYSWTIAKKKVPKAAVAPLAPGA